MKDYPRHNSRKLLWIFQDSQTLTHPDSFAFHSLWHNFTPVVVVGGWWAMACRSLQNFIVVLKQKVYLFPFLSISKTIAFGGSPPRTFATPNTSIHFIFSFFCCFSHSRSSSFLSWWLLWRNESGQVRASQDVRTPVHIYRSAGWGLERLTFMTLGTGYR